MSAILRLLDVSLIRGGETIVPPTTLEVRTLEHTARTCSGASNARALAMLAAGLIRPTRGSVLIGEYDPRVQPVHCKHLVGFVPHDPLILTNTSFARYIDYRAAIWNIDAQRARAHAALLLERLGELHEAFAYPIVAALLPSPQLLVLDRPQPLHAGAILAAATATAMFSTHTDAESAAPFRARRAEQVV